MTIFARDLDTGMAKWVYQMTPHDEWDFDGVNEVPLIDVDIKGKKVPALVHFDRNGIAYTMNRETGELLVAQKYDPVGELDDRRGHEDGPSGCREAVLTACRGSRRQCERHLSGRAGYERPAAGKL